ncbi:Uncharacterized protein TCM_025109 [Theobroma cacao]|uniref:Uncharacterized protein n=1 Tax=Theobroma cacao TaxID=3641 RepID=A0A061EYK5_THECC|nr:Uncharacterized protein TCM_025109 [Theobroma cacao]
MKLTSQNVVLNIVTYTAFINGMCHVERLSVAQELFKGISAHDLVPNMVTYAILLCDGYCLDGIPIDGLSQVGQLRVGKKLFYVLTVKRLHPSFYTKDFINEGYQMKHISCLEKWK